MVSTKAVFNVDVHSLYNYKQKYIETNQRNEKKSVLVKLKLKGTNRTMRGSWKRNNKPLKAQTIMNRSTPVVNNE